MSKRQIKIINGEKKLVIQREDGTTVFKPYIPKRAAKALEYLDQLEAMERRSSLRLV